MKIATSNLRNEYILVGHTGKRLSRDIMQEQSALWRSVSGYVTEVLRRPVNGGFLTYVYAIMRYTEVCPCQRCGKFKPKKWMRFFTWHEFYKEELRWNETGKWLCLGCNNTLEAFNRKRQEITKTKKALNKIAQEIRNARHEKNQRQGQDRNMRGVT